MKKIILPVLLLFCMQCFAQQSTYDVFTFTDPEGWTKDEVVSSNINFTKINNQTRSWCRIVVYKSTAGQGNIDADFTKEWNDLVLSSKAITDPPVMTAPTVQNGWTKITGSASYMFNNTSVQVSLTTFSANGRCTSILFSTNDLALFQPAISKFMIEADIKTAENNTGTTVNAEIKTTAPAAITTAFQFNTTNFDDGWTSVIKEDWVEAYKGDIRVLLHYPRQEEKKYISQHDEATRFFWDLFVAPRYSNLRNFELLNYNMSSEPASFACGLLTDNATGADVWVTLFKKAKSGWIEIITKDKQSFVDAFGINNPNQYFSEWEPLQKLSGYNKFAVGENDLTGKWSTDYSNSTAYYNVYTGIYAGSSTYASRQTFVFGSDKSFSWEIFMARGGMGASMNVDHGKAGGNFKFLNNWQLWFSEIEKKQKTYNAYFSCIKGGRVLWLQDVSYGSYTAFGKIE